MNTFLVIIVKILRRVFTLIFGRKVMTVPECERDPDKASLIIYDALVSDKPCMISRFGNTEIICLCNYLGVKSHNKNYYKIITRKAYPWWWQSSIIKQMQQWSGFFPPQVDKIEKFCDLMLEDIPEIDVLGSWLPEELFFEKELKNAINVDLELLNPFFSQVPWTKALKGKKVLVVHPFAKTIEDQYKKRKLLLPNNILPDFELKTIKAVQSIAGEETQFPDWFKALEHMESEIEKVDFDICLIGCGAYGLPLAAYVKRLGKKSVHIGGSLQLLFGIRGRRWEISKNRGYDYSKLMNQNWASPSEEERPSNSDIVEGSCYW